MTRDAIAELIAGMSGRRASLSKDSTWNLLPTEAKLFCSLHQLGHHQLICRSAASQPGAHCITISFIRPYYLSSRLVSSRLPPSMTSVVAGRVSYLLTPEQVEEFKRNGLLVLSHHLSPDELRDAHMALRQTLQKYGVDSSSSESLWSTGNNLASLSSTNGSGGVLDVFYPRWKMGIALNHRLFAITKQLWRECYCYNGEDINDLSEGEKWKWHPFGQFNPDIGYAYIDRIGYRLPTKLAEELGKKIAAEKEETECNGCNGNTKTKTSPRRKRSRPIQRSLTPHLDCCPDTFYSSENKSKFRPIQCMVSLTDNLEPNTGGFEAVQGFHHEFASWRTSRQPSLVNTADGEQIIPPPCLGDYTHIRPKEDSDVFRRVQHVPVRAGDIVLWDNRLPHSNAYKHTGDKPRSVIYCSFLPDVSVNRKYIQSQLQDFLALRKPGDQWIEESDKREDEEVDISSLDDLSRHLLGIDPW